jgi:RNAse (barnase) inhibitor barstar
LREIEEQRAEINNRIMPAVIQTTRKEERSKTFNEKGVLGTVGGFLFGEKKKIVEIPVVEDSAYRAEAAKRDSELQDLKSEKAELTARLDNSIERDLCIANKSYDRKKAELDRLEEKYVELIRENREKFQNKYNAQIQKARSELRNLLGDKTEELINEVKKILRSQEKKYTGIVSSVIMANLKQALIDERKKQENLRARLNSSEQERDERIANLAGRLKALEAILENAVSIKTELEGLSIENVD